MNPILREFEKAQMRTDIPDFTPGDTVRVHVRIKEGDKARIQGFEESPVFFAQDGLFEEIGTVAQGLGQGHASPPARDLRMMAGE